MKKTLLASALLVSATAAQAGPWQVIQDWDYINEAGFFNSQTGYADNGSFSDPWNADQPANNIPGVTTTVDGTYAPTDSSATDDPTVLDGNAGTMVVPGEHYVDSQGYNWFYNPEVGKWFNYGTTTASTVGTTGTSNDGFTTILEQSQLAGYDIFDSACWGLANQSDPSCVTFKDENGVDSSRVTGTAMTGIWGPKQFFNGVAVTHENNPAGAPSLTSIFLADGLQLADSALAGGSILAPELFIPINFVETFAGSNSLWPEAPDDMFILNFGGPTPITLDFGPGYVDFIVGLTLDNSDFMLNGQDYHKEYEITTRLSGLEFFQAAGGTLVAGVLTEENQNNTLNAQFSINAVNVPEPATIGFFGLGLLGLAGLARRKKA